MKTSMKHFGLTVGP